MRERASSAPATAPTPPSGARSASSCAIWAAPPPAASPCPPWRIPATSPTASRENEEESPWSPLSVERGLRARREHVISAFAGAAPQTVYDHQSRTGEDLLVTIARSLAVISHHKSTHHGDTLLVVSPEHARLLAGDGWDRARHARLPLGAPAQAGARARARRGRRRGAARPRPGQVRRTRAPTRRSLPSSASRPTSSSWWRAAPRAASPRWSRAGHFPRCRAW